MKRKLLIITAVCSLLIVNSISAQVPSPVLSFTFDDDVSEGGSLTDEVAGISAELMGSAYCADGDLVLEQMVDSLPDFMEMDAAGIELNAYSEFSILVSFTSDTLDYNGVKNQHIALWSFGDTYDYNGGLGVDYMYFAPSRQGADKAQAFIACGYGAYCFEHQDTSAMYEPNLMDDTRHEVVVTFNDYDLGLFVDGELVGYTEVNADTNNIMAISAAQALIGKSTYGTNFVSAFKGRVHEFQIFDEVLDDDEVETLFLNTGIKPGTADSRPLVYSTGTSVVIDLYNNNSVKAQINIYDLTGKLVKSKKYNGAKQELSLTSGLYIVKIENKDNTYTQKVIVAN